MMVPGQPYYLEHPEAPRRQRVSHLLTSAVIKHYFIDQKARGARGVVHNLVPPAIGFALTVWLWTSLSGLSASVWHGLRSAWYGSPT